MVGVHSGFLDQLLGPHPLFVFVACISATSASTTAAVSSTASPLCWESHILLQDGAGAAVVAVALAVAVVAVLGAALAATAAMVVV